MIILINEINFLYACNRDTVKGVPKRLEKGQLAIIAKVTLDLIKLVHAHKVLHLSSCRGCQIMHLKKSCCSCEKG